MCSYAPKPNENVMHLPTEKSGKGAERNCALLIPLAWAPEYVVNRLEYATLIIKKELSSYKNAEIGIIY